MHHIIHEGRRASACNTPCDMHPRRTRKMECSRLSMGGGWVGGWVGEQIAECNTLCARPSHPEDGVQQVEHRDGVLQRVAPLPAVYIYIYI